VHTYQVYDGGTAPVMSSDFAIDVYVSVRSAAAGARAGVVFNFSDPGNYYALLLSAAGDVQLKSVIGGVASQLSSATFTSYGAGTWTHIRLVRSHDTTSVQIDGKPVTENVRQAGLPDGDVGLLADRTSAWFDDFSVLNAELVPTPFFTLNPGYLEDFGDAVADGWEPASGSWTVVGGEYRSIAVAPTAITLSAIPEMLNVVNNDRYAHYTVKARLRNRYANSGNLVGMVIGYRDPQNYHEVVFSPRGEAKINTVSAGARSTLASGTYIGGGRNQWFDAEVVYIERENVPARAYVTVNGRQVFDAVALPWPSARVGFVTHWSLASFDDVRALANMFRPYVDDFEQGFPISYGNWESRDGTLRSLVAGRAEMFELPAWRDFMDIDVRAWMVNHYGSSGNLLGLVYGLRSDPGLPAEGNYFEVVFSPVGIARLNRVFKGQVTTIATASYQGGGAHRWFNVQVLHRQSYTTVKVNGVTIFDNVYQPDAQTGGLALVTHWSLASFDDISVKQAPR
jgi:hypothetical protein